jgi:hypothetical protein
MKCTKWAPVLVLAVMAAGCEKGPTGPESPTPGFTHAPGTVGMLADTERLWVCKDGPAGTYNFSVDYAGGPGNQIIVGAFSVDAGACVHIASSGVPLTASIFETNMPLGTHLDDITVDYAGNNVTPEQVFVAARSVDVTIGEDTDGAGGVAPSGAVVTFINKEDPPPPGGEGCTPGYWKNHTSSWAGTGYAPGDDFDATFGVNFFNPDITLLQAAGQGGGGKNALARHAVAALLNAASSVQYDLTEAQVIALVQAAAASGNYESAKNTLEGFNEQGCPLN